MKRFGNVLRYLFILILNIAIMVVFQSYLNFLLLIGLIVVPLFSFYSLQQVRKSFQLQIFTPIEPMHKGAEFLVRIVLHNPTWFSLLNATIRLEIENTFFREDGVHFLNIPVRAHGSSEAMYPIVMDYCGRFVVNAQYIVLVDLLGIFEIKVPLDTSGECLVLPKGVKRQQEAGMMYMNGVSEAMESKEKGYDFSDISGIREYIPGDKLQNIHWKLSVKKEELMVKERVSVSAMQLHVLVDLANNEQMCADAVLDLADGITMSFVSMNLPFTVYYYSSNLGELQSAYIGNEKERIQWMERMLYDRCYKEQEFVEDLFLKEHQSGTYLYIGLDANEQNTENMMLGANDSIAVLRNGNRS